ncbi:hypothetical protein ACOSQ3_009245 [Xanthoceras sorbifolium]
MRQCRVARSTAATNGQAGRLGKNVINKSLLKQKSVKTVVRKLLHEVVKLSGNRLLLLKNIGVSCFQESAWDCPECNFLNYRRNMACFHCDCKRPPDDFMDNKMEERRQGLNMRMEKIAKRPEVSNAWNFDFDDDDESDGADVAAFEYADSPTKGEDSALVSQAHAENFGEHEYDFNKSRTVRSAHERGHSYLDRNRSGVE